MPITISGSTGIAGVDGSASPPAVQGTDTNTGIAFPAADTVAIGTGGTERMRVDSSGNVGIGTTSPGTGIANRVLAINGTDAGIHFLTSGADTNRIYSSSGEFRLQTATAIPLVFYTNNAERARIDSSGNLLVGTTNSNPVGANVSGFKAGSNGETMISAAGIIPFYVNRKTNDGTLVEFWQDGNVEGNISVSGTTVSYNGGHLARWSQLPTNQRDPSLLKGTVLTNLDEMCVWLDEEGNPQPNEQLNKMKISDVEGDPNVAGVFVSWDNDDQTYTDDMNVAMTGDMIIRIAQGVVVQKGDLLMSAGDGTAKPQGDDIRRSKTVAKVTSNHVTCTYADGSYCVPCVLMAC
jgi:hypothetical protein